MASNLNCRNRVLPFTSFILWHALLSRLPRCAASVDASRNSEDRLISAQLGAHRGFLNLPIEARVGANTGEVVMRSIATGEGHTEYTPIGHTANLASRMQALAPTDSIAISEQTRRLLFGDSDGISTEIKTRWRGGEDLNPRYRWPKTEIKYF
jgi:class 3 adenylate cyclase